MSGEHVAGTRRVHVAVLGGGSVAMLALGSASLNTAIGGWAALLWAAVTGTILLGESYFFLSRRASATTTRRPDGLCVANVVTLVRGWLYAAVGGFVVVSPVGAAPAVATVAWLPAVCFGTGVGLDWVDGKLARSTGGGTRLGEQLDMAFDTLGFLVAPLVAVTWGLLPVWYLSLSAARYLFKAGRELRRRRNQPVHALPPSRVRRPLSAVQMVFLTVALVPTVPRALVVSLAAVLLAASLSVFARDYLVVAGFLP